MAPQTQINPDLLSFARARQEYSLLPAELGRNILFCQREPGRNIQEHIPQGHFLIFRTRWQPAKLQSMHDFILYTYKTFVLACFQVLERVHMFSSFQVVPFSMQVMGNVTWCNSLVFIESTDFGSSPTRSWQPGVVDP